MNPFPARLSLPRLPLGAASAFPRGTALWLAVTLLAAWTSPAGLVAGERLNVVFILADDLGYGEVGAYGQTKIPTPNLDRLAAEGIRFTDHYTGAPVCAPARCVLMTGRHLGRAEVRDNFRVANAFPEFTEGQYPLSAEAVTIAKVFQEAGYATGAMGKWGMGPVGSSGEPSRQGFDLFFGYNCQAVAHSFYPPYLWRNDEQIVINENPVPGHERQPEGEVRLEDWVSETYAPYLMIAEAEQFIAEHAERPFFLYLPFIEPHVAMHPPREAVDRFPEEWDDEAYRGQCGYLPHPRPRAGYAAMINDLDSYVGRVLEALEKAGIDERTLVIFTSDNGTTHPRNPDTHFHVGGVDGAFFDSVAGLRGWKGSVYEGGIRVPTMARLPGVIPAGVVDDSPSYAPDWFPTLCEAAGLDKPEGLDGESLWPVLKGEVSGRSRDKPMIWVFTGYQGQVAVRDGDLKAVRQRLKTPEPGPWEVYDLSTDPGETTDLSADLEDFIAAVEELLRHEVPDNERFPLVIPGVNDGAGE